MIIEHFFAMTKKTFKSKEKAEECASSVWSHSRLVVNYVKPNFMRKMDLVPDSFFPVNRKLCLGVPKPS